MSKRLRWGLLTVWTVAMGLTLSCVLCVPALARSYKVGPVGIDATVAKDGSLLVTEDRTYVVSGSINGVIWDVPRGTYEGRSVEATVRQVSATTKVGTTDLVQGDSAEPRTYTHQDADDCIRLTLYWPAQDETVTFRVTYELSNLVTRWSDTAELYWQYVPADEEAEAAWNDVTATIHLPVPLGEPVQPGKNVRAWAHGPLDGAVEFVGSDVVYTSPGVGTAEYLEARVAFPPSWLPEAPVQEQAHLQSILDEEEAWANEANAKRRHARMVYYGVPAALFAVSILCPLISWLYAGWVRRRLPKAHFDDTYYRDVPSGDHPAVLAMLYRGGQPNGADFTASLMRLADLGRLSMRQVRGGEAGKHNKSASAVDLELTAGGVPRANAEADAETQAIDNATMAFLFDSVVVGLSDSPANSSNRPSMRVSQLEQLSSSDPRAYRKACDAWLKAVNDAYQSRGFASDKTVTPGFMMGYLGLGEMAFAVLAGIIGWLFDLSSGLFFVAIVACLVSGIGCIYACDLEEIPILSQEALELRAKLAALKRWLADFTRLEEAIPTDVVLWNRLLVMAAALGVAQQVLAQLRKVQPQLLTSDDFVGSAWGGGDVDERQIPLSVVGHAYERAWDKSANRSEHYVSSSSSASSRDSSSGGSGGGFSGSRSGGGGFSGGGRGGVF